MICFFCLVLTPILFVCGELLIHKGEKEIGLHSSAVVVEYDGRYYWKYKSEKEINFDLQRRVSQEQYNVYYIYQLAGKLTLLLGGLLFGSAGIYMIITGELTGLPPLKDLGKFRKEL